MICRCGTCRRCNNRRYHAKYRQTEKGRATEARYRHGARGRVTHQRINARRIFVGQQCHGHADTIDLAASINARIKEKLREFVERQQAGADLEGGAPSAVCPSATDRTHRVGGIDPHPRN